MMGSAEKAEVWSGFLSAEGALAFIQVKRFVSLKFPSTTLDNLPCTCRLPHQTNKGSRDRAEVEQKPFTRYTHPIHTRRSTIGAKLSSIAVSVEVEWSSGRTRDTKNRYENFLSFALQSVKLIL